jgi:hypothetical protein
MKIFFCFFFLVFFRFSSHVDEAQFFSEWSSSTSSQASPAASLWATSEATSSPRCERHKKNPFFSSLMMMKKKNNDFFFSRFTHTQRKLPVRAKSRKGAKTKAHSNVKQIVREVCGFAPYEKRVIELLRTELDKRALRFAKKRLGSHQRAKRKREEVPSSEISPSRLFLTAVLQSQMSVVLRAQRAKAQAK